MNITIELPAGVVYAGTKSWFVSQDDGWTVSDLTADVRYATRSPSLVAVFGGVALDGADLVHDVLEDGDVVTFVEA